MDRETKRAYQLVQATIVENLDRLMAAQKAKQKLSSADVNDLKKWRRFGAAFAWDPSVFQDVLEKPYMKPEELISRLRKTEDGLMRQFQYVDKIPLHHIIADRTGGDLGIRTPIDIWEDTKKRIFDLTGATPGNNQANLNALGAFDELWHQGRLGAKGSVFAEVGLIRPEDFPYLHRAGQNLADKLGLDPKMVQASSEEQVKALMPAILQQQDRFAETTATPQVQQQRSVFSRFFPEIVDPSTPPEQIQLIKQATRETSLPKIFAEAGSITYNPQKALEEFMAGPEATLVKNQLNKGRAKLGLPPLKGIELRMMLFPPGAEEMGKAIARNPVEAVTGAAMNLADPDVIKSLFQGKPKEALEKGAMGAGIGAGLAEVLKVNPVQQARLASYASKIPGVASQIPRALQIGGAVARFASPAAMAVGGYQVADAILEGSTGAGFVDTIKQVQDKERTAEINEAAVESAAKSKQLAVEKELPKPILDSDTIEKFVTDPLNELEYGWKRLTGQV